MTLTAISLVVYDVSQFAWGMLYILLLFYVAVIVITITNIITDKRDPLRTLTWITVIALLPMLGLVFYTIFGQNFRKHKLFKRKSDEDSAALGSILLEQRYEVNSAFVHSKEEVGVCRDAITLLLNSNRTPLTHGNKVDILTNGANAFESILSALRKANRFIHMEYYMIYDDVIGGRIADILIEKASSGVEVRIIFDDVGSWGLSESYIKRLRSAGVKIFAFMPVRFHRFTSKVNYRNHRKIIVIDGEVAFTGGVNIADKYLVGIPHIGHWRDTHLRIEGGAVSALQSIFYNDWNFVSGESLDDKSLYFPQTKAVGDVSMQIASSGPDSDWASIMQCFFLAIAKASSHIYITTPYFLPNEPILTAIKVASLSGIKVKILLPSCSDSKVVHWASRSYISELLEAGVSIYLYRAGFVHSKVITIDGVFSSVGSANMDVRSFEDNFEVTAMMYDRDIAEQLESQFKRDTQRADRVRIEDWAQRSGSKHLKESLARLLTPLL